MKEKQLLYENMTRKLYTFSSLTSHWPECGRMAILSCKGGWERQAVGKI